MNPTNRTPENLQPARARSRVRWALALGLTLTTLAMGGAALAKPPHGPGGFGGAMFARAFHDLDLTEQQELKTIRIRRNLMEQGQEARKELKGTMAKVADELEKPNPDASKLHGIADEVMRRIAKIAHSAVDQVVELQATFSPEQRTRLAEHLRRFAERQDGDRERGGPDGRPDKRPAR